MCTGGGIGRTVGAAFLNPTELIAGEDSKFARAGWEVLDPANITGVNRGESVIAGMTGKALGIDGNQLADPFNVGYQKQAKERTVADGWKTYNDAIAERSKVNETTVVTRDVSSGINVGT